VASQPHVSVAGDSHGRCAEAAQGDPGLVKRGDARQHRRAKGSSCGRSEWTSGKDAGEWHALIGFDGHPDTVGIGAPGKHRRERRMPVLREPLKARHGSRGLGSRHRDLVHDHGFSVLEHGLPTLARTRCHKFDQPRFGLALRHYGCMVPLPHVAYVIVQPCIGVKDASCVEVCPVDCIHTDDAADMYYIDPDECIDCGACVDPCPVDAIFPEDEVPEQWRDFIKINADYFKNRQ
jgi:NAD-dependent dihydropyrimidine dehydrogenase PreA subunit